MGCRPNEQAASSWENSNPFMFSSSAGTTQQQQQQQQQYQQENHDESSTEELEPVVVVLLVVIVLVLCFLGFAMEETQWSETISKAEKEVLMDAMYNCERQQMDTNNDPRQRPPWCTSTPSIQKANFEATYTDTSYNEDDESENDNQGQGNTQPQHSYGTLSFSTHQQQQQQQQQQGDTPESTASSAEESTDRDYSSCRTIKGEGCDRDGNFQIVKGLVSPHTGKCYWVERSVEEPTEEILITGRFQMLKSSSSSSSVLQFYGGWKAKNGELGTFERFDLYKLEDPRAPTSSSPRSPSPSSPPPSSPPLTPATPY